MKTTKSNIYGTIKYAYLTPYYVRTFFQNFFSQLFHFFHNFHFFQIFLFSGFPDFSDFFYFPDFPISRFFFNFEIFRIFQTFDFSDMTDSFCKSCIKHWVCHQQVTFFILFRGGKQ